MALEQPPKSLSKKDKLAWLDEYDKRKSANSLFYFGKYFLDYDLYERTHSETCSLLDDDSKQFILLLLPRGTFKTTIASQMYVVKKLIKNPNARILLDSEVLQNSQNNLGVIKRIFSDHKRFRSVYGDYTSKIWTQDFITVGKRTDISLKEPSVTASSIETVQVGPHYDEIICDDLHSEKNTRSKEQIAWVIKHFKLLFSLLEPGGRVVVIGTRWREDDLYGLIIDELKNFNVISKSAYLENGELFFPERLTKEFLEMQKKMIGTELFNSQYMNNPLPSEEDASFKRSQFKYFKETPDDLDIYLSVDPALPGDDTSDYFAIDVGGINRDNDLYMLDTYYGHWSPGEAIDKIFQAAGKWERRGIKAIGIETNLFQRLIKYDFMVQMKKRNKYYNVVELKHYNKSKDDRILSLQPRYACGAVYHHHSMKDGELEEELLKFPKGKKKDLIDAQASLLEIAKIRSQKKEKKLPTHFKSLDEAILKHVEWNRTHKKETQHPVMGREY